MGEVALFPDLNREFAGLSDVAALQAEVGSMREQLAIKHGHLALERQLAENVHRARNVAILGSPALRLVYDIEDFEPTRRRPDQSIDSVLSSAFMRKVVTRCLPEGLAPTLAKRLRTDQHPDVGGNTETAKQVGQALDDSKVDPTFSLTRAILAAPSLASSDPAMLRDERYRLSLAIDGAGPHFDSEEEARKSAEVEISGAEWRVRVQAAFMCFDLIIGDSDTWNRHLQSIANEGHAYSIELVNRLQPAILSLQERLAKGDPLRAESLDTAAIDAIFERIWSTLKKKDGGSLPYSPPYQNWLPILLPAMQMLDPGEKPGEEYTHYQPPIQIKRPRQRISDYGESDWYSGNKISEKNLINYGNKDRSYEDNY